ncbi:hypothetical protein K7862_06235 [Streptomyces sp. PLK6-54]|uniref:DUF2273 domain-containing protein n=1 Tax=Actinacidiphila acidipaludis TaxID=2873382 RepID=A0ABS7Q272_9ACTN|nr:hypothetical protein [Streptomyces acidipaludis]MBY8877241.1 hypothetical protein [Streptomyces acidipaludis]
MTSTSTGLLTGLALGFAGYFGGFGAFVVVAVVGLAGLAIGYLLHHGDSAPDYLRSRGQDLRRGMDRRRGPSRRRDSDDDPGTRSPAGSRDGHKVRVR